MIQDGDCFFCGQEIEIGKTLTLDHVIPRYLGGADVLVAACFPCNYEKGCRYPTKAELYKFINLMDKRPKLARFWRRRAIREARDFIKTQILLTGAMEVKVESKPEKIDTAGIRIAANTIAGAAERIAQAAERIENSNNRFLLKYEALIDRMESAKKPSIFEQVFGR
jgi:hypothetical protein